MLDLITNIPQAKVYFPPQEMPSNGSGQKPLSIGQALVIDKAQAKIDVINILGIPLDVAPGLYSLDVSVRAKKSGQGQSYWYKAHRQLEQQKQ